MKNLLKITMSLAMVLLISSTVFAQDDGVVTVSVPEYLAYDGTPDFDIMFQYDEFGDNDILSVPQILNVKTNVDWKVTITASNMDANMGICTINGVGLLVTQTYNKEWTEKSLELTWALSPFGSHKAGTYTLADLVYSLEKQ